MKRHENVKYLQKILTLRVYAVAMGMPFDGTAALSRKFGAGVNRCGGRWKV